MMLEVVTLDLVEQIIGKMNSPLLAADAKIGTWLLSDFRCNVLSSGDSTVASSLAQTLALVTNRPARFPATDFSKIWFSAASPSYKTILFDVATETVAFDDNVGRGFTQMFMDNAGTMWAQATQSGYYGLWKRTGSATWTQMLSDSGQATGLRWRPSDNSLWYRSYTSNHYQVANGSVTLSEAPTGTLISVNSETTSYYLDAPVLMPTQVGGPNYSGRNLFINRDGTVNTAPNPCVPYEVGLFTKWTGNTWVSWYQVHIDATYSLLWGCGGGNLSTSPYQHFHVVNKITGTIKHIGSLQSIQTGTVSDCSRLAPFAAKWNNNYLRIYLAGSVVCYLNANTTNNMGGIMSIDIPCQPNF